MNPDHIQGGVVAVSLYWLTRILFGSRKIDHEVIDGLRKQMADERAELKAEIAALNVAYAKCQEDHAKAEREIGRLSEAVKRLEGERSTGYLS